MILALGGGARHPGCTLTPGDPALLGLSFNTASERLREEKAGVQA